MPALSTSVACVIMPLILHTCWLLEASAECVSRASPRIPGLTPTMPRGLPAPWVPLLPANQTQVEEKPELVSPQTWGLSAGDAACRDGICVFGDRVANPGSQGCGLLQAFLGTALPPSPRSAIDLPVPFGGCRHSIPPPSGSKFLWLLARPLGPEEGWASGQKDPEPHPSPCTLQVL